MNQRTPLSNVIQAFSLIITMMAEELEKSGAFNRAAFAKRLRDTADEAERIARPELQDDPRVDLQIARLVAGLLSKKQPQRWTPVVIDGGQNDQSQD
jgi:hypothetical protein